MHMMLLSLALADSAEPVDDVEDEATEQVEGELEALDDGEFVEEFDEASGTIQRVRVRRPAPVEKSYRDEALALAAVLGLLLFLRVNRRESAKRTRPKRRTPLSVDELATCVFEASRTADLLMYRDLFLNGGEAAGLLGRENAEGWLASRSQKHLTDSLATLGAHCSEDSFLAEAWLEGEVLVLRIRAEDLDVEAPVATAKKVGQAWRLYEIVES